MLRRSTLAVLALCLVPLARAASEPPRFAEWFEDRTLRIDLLQFGDAETQLFSVDQLLDEGPYAGNPDRLLDESGQGMYFAVLRDERTDAPLWSRGFATQFGEYRTTADAKRGVMRGYHHAIRAPYPRRPVVLVVEGRGADGRLEPLYRARIDPANVNIVREKPHEGVEVEELAVNGPPAHQCDLVFVAEGYTAEEKDKFLRDARRFTRALLRTEPFARRRADLSLRAAFFPSSESGVDEPRQGIFRNTAVDAAFNALDLDRYLLIDDTRAMNDIAAATPYDHVVVLVNSRRYGGGGIYGDYCVCTVDHGRSEEVFLHELGHAFGNLADEYFGAEVSYDEFYPPGVEPHEPNITALLDPENVKWKHLLSPDIPVPTPWGQEELADVQVQEDLLRTERDAERMNLEMAGESREKVREMEAEYDVKLRELRAERGRIRRHYEELYRGKIGVFEGAGYTARGLYRSEIHVGMFHDGSYGPVSEEAIERVIDRFTAGAE